MDARPFLKWAGGKTQLLPYVEQLLPNDFNNYHEPFVGSAAVYFHLYNLKQTSVLKTSMNRVTLTDANEELINCFRMVRDQVEPLIKVLATHKRNHSPAYYYTVRAQNPQRLSSVRRAARLIYLNKTCYNGLYRVNSRGQFNVPMGTYKNPAIVDPDSLLAANRALRRVHIRAGDYRRVLDRAVAGDFIYLDPPYHPWSPTANFTSYTEDNFGEAQQEELAEAVKELDRRGCMVMLSNSASGFIGRLYTAFRKTEVLASRLISCNGDRRSKVYELVICNY